MSLYKYNDVIPLYEACKFSQSIPDKNNKLLSITATKIPGKDFTAKRMQQQVLLLCTQLTTKYERTTSESLSDRCYTGSDRMRR